MRPVAVFRFSPTEGPAGFARWLDAAGVDWQLLPLDAGVAVPSSVRDFAGIGMMGGPMSANDDLPWTAPLLDLLRDAVSEGVPVIGHCLGGQLLARALGAQVTRAAAAEFGWIGVESPAGPARQAWFGDRPSFTAFQWHNESFALPPGAVRVLTSRFNAEQGYVLDDRHIGLQCHLEMTSDLVEAWLATGADELPPATVSARQCAAEIRVDLAARVAALDAVAADVYRRWAEGLRA
jgi:GMP synthase-like glutamine amidotransferase